MAYILGISGSYRAGGIISQALDAALAGLRERGHEVESLILSEKKISYCTNCRSCTQPQGTEPGKCVLEDDMAEVLEKVRRCDALILASPINFGTVTAVMKAFIERLLPYAFWPWGKSVPKYRVSKLSKRAALIVSSSCPAFLGRLIMPTALRQLKVCARVFGARAVKSLYLGGICSVRDQGLSAGDLKKAARLGEYLVG
jgi:multimeric flavodoxin WrbA